MPLAPLDQLLAGPAFAHLPRPDTRPVNVDALDINATVRPDSRLRVDIANGDRYRAVQAEIYVKGIVTAIDLFGTSEDGRRFTSAATLRGDTVTMIAFLRQIADTLEGKGK